MSDALLTALVFLPVAGAILMLLVPRASVRAQKLLGLGMTGLVFLVSLVLVRDFQPGRACSSRSRARGCRRSASRTTWAWTASACGW